MTPSERHGHTPDVSFDGGSLDCGSGLLLLIRKHVDPMRPGQLLEILSVESSVEEDLPAWCRLTGNELVSWTRHENRRSFLVCKGPYRTPKAPPAAASVLLPQQLETARDKTPAQRPQGPQRLDIPSLSVMGVGSWPRPPWMLRTIHERLEGRMSDEEFTETAEDAIRLAVDAQVRAGVDVVTDGEQSRDGYASFVGGLLDNCQLVPLTDLLAFVDDPEEFAQELRALDVPAHEVRHPVVYGPLERRRPLALQDLLFVQTLTEKPVKVALPGPYLLTRTMWLECMTDRAYETREMLAADIVRILREEASVLLAQGAAWIQFDEPVLTEVVFSGTTKRRTFMCGALSEKKDVEQELDFAAGLMNQVVQGLPLSRTAVHVCRGNWTQDEELVLAGDYRPLMPWLKRMNVGAFLLEMCTPRAGDMEILRELPEDRRIGVGLVNPKDPAVESVEEIVARGRKAIALFGKERVVIHPDCGFATFADNPVTPARVAEAKLRSLVRAAETLRSSAP